MSEDKKHIKFDTSFLSKKRSEKSDPDLASKSASFPTALSAPSVSTKYKFNWKNIFVMAGIIVFLGVIYLNSQDASNVGSPYSSNTQSPKPNTSSSKPTPLPNPSVSAPNTDEVTVGQFTCTIYHSNQADKLEPSSFTKQQLTKELQSLDARSQELDIMKASLDSIRVDNTNQASIDAYNVQVDRYNTKFALYKSINTKYNTKVDDYNLIVDTYNRYLNTNCRKRY